MTEIILSEQTKGKFLLQINTERTTHNFYLEEQEVINLLNIQVVDRRVKT